jgi:hypothetical protein
MLEKLHFVTGLYRAAAMSWWPPLWQRTAQCIGSTWVYLSHRNGMTELESALANLAPLIAPDSAARRLAFASTFGDLPTFHFHQQPVLATSS